MASCASSSRLPWLQPSYGRYSIMRKSLCCASRGRRSSTPS
jgi:hypothetical protein